MTILTIALILAGLATAAALTLATRLILSATRRKIGLERATGHLGLRRRMANLTGRRGTNQHATVVPAETMRGWVWFVWTRNPRQPFYEATGWAPTRWLARRAQARYCETRRRESSTPRR